MAVVSGSNPGSATIRSAISEEGSTVHLVTTDARGAGWRSRYNMRFPSRAIASACPSAGGWPTGTMIHSTWRRSSVEWDGGVK